MRIPVLDHGYVELIEVSGGDVAEHIPAMRARRVDEPRDWATDRKLTKYMYENGHTSPFEFLDLTWRVKCPIFVARQWVRHRTANMNELSQRYEDLTETVEFYNPAEWRGQGKTNRQVGDEPLPAGEQFAANIDYHDALEVVVQAYTSMIEYYGVAREQARMILPLSTYTEFVWKNDLHNTLHFLRLRADEHAQWEIRQYAEAMLVMMQEALPNLMEVVWP